MATNSMAACTQHRSTVSRLLLHTPPLLLFVSCDVARDAIALSLRRRCRVTPLSLALALLVATTLPVEVARARPLRASRTPPKPTSVWTSGR